MDRFHGPQGRIPDVFSGTRGSACADWKGQNSRLGAAKCPDQRGISIAR
jgi:hypothetical protein